MRSSAFWLVLLGVASVLALTSTVFGQFTSLQGFKIPLQPSTLDVFDSHFSPPEKYVSRREDGGCAGTRPGANFVCVQGAWTWFNTTVSSGGTIDATGYEVNLMGSLYMASGSKLVTKGLGAGVWVEKCALLESTITFSLSKLDVDQIGRDKHTKYGAEYDLLESGCNSAAKAKAEVVSQPRECRRWKASLATRPIPNGRYILAVTFSSDHSRCNYWWIILISILLITPAVIFVLWVIYRLFCKPKPRTRSTVRIQE